MENQLKINISKDKQKCHSRSPYSLPTTSIHTPGRPNMYFARKIPFRNSLYVGVQTHVRFGSYDYGSDDLPRTGDSNPCDMASTVITSHRDLFFPCVLRWKKVGIIAAGNGRIMNVEWISRHHPPASAPGFPRTLWLMLVLILLSLLVSFRPTVFDEGRIISHQRYSRILSLRGVCGVIPWRRYWI